MWATWFHAERSSLSESDVSAFGPDWRFHVEHE
jgi:hypothetical protein